MRTAVIANRDFEIDHSARIDSADRVIRFRTSVNLGRGTGTKTDVIAICNYGTTKKRETYDAIPTSRHFAEAREIWLPLPPSLSHRLLLSDPFRYLRLQQNFCDFTADLIGMAGRKPVQRLLDTAHYFAFERRLKALTKRRFAFPSGGACVCEYLMEIAPEPDHEVELYGFSHKGWVHHPWAAEKALADGYVASGRIKRFPAVEAEAGS